MHKANCWPKSRYPFLSYCYFVVSILGMLPLIIAYPILLMIVKFVSIFHHGTEWKKLDSFMTLFEGQIEGYLQVTLQVILCQSDFIQPINPKYRVSHGKVNKVIWLCSGYRFWFLLLLWIICVHEIGPFMLSLLVFIQLMFCFICGLIRKHLLFLSEFWIILNFRGYFKIHIKSSKPGNGKR